MKCLLQDSPHPRLTFVNGDVGEGVSQAVAASSPVETLARIGYVVHGIVYVVIGLLAARLAWGARGELADPPSAIEKIYEQPLGQVLVIFVAAGLAAYALWRLVQAIADPDRQGTGLKGLVVRIGRFVSGVGYAGLAFFAGQLVAGSAGSSGSNATWATRLLTEPVGALLGALLAVILLVVATDDIRKACTNNFGERLQHHKMSSGESLFSKCAGSWGFASRAVILIFAGGYLMRAVFEANPARAKGFEGILASLLHLPYGHFVLAFVALGLTSYGVFMAQAGLRRRHPF